MATATHRVDIVPVVLEPHPNADSLSIVKIWNFQVVVRTADWESEPNVPLAELLSTAEGRAILNQAPFKGVKKGAYIQPDSLVDVTRPEFSWLKKFPEDQKPQRIKVIRLRGALSMGLLIPAPEGAQLGDDVAELLNVRHYEPPTVEEREQGGGPSLSAETFTVPNIWVPKYDVESMYRYGSVFVPGEKVVATEKLDGENTKFMWDGDRMWAGTRKEWKKPDFFTRQGQKAGPWRILDENPWIAEFCKRWPMNLLYGETFGWVQSLRYGAMPGEVWFRAFDVLQGGRWWDWSDLISEIDEKNLVPLLGVTDFDFATVQMMAEGPTLIPVMGNTNPPDKKGKNPIPNLREGACVRPGHERTDPVLGRVHLKFVSNTYLETVKSPDE